jgi:N6-L-threonylcarbamoyladenine synthase
MEGHILSGLIKKENETEFKIQNILNKKNLSLLISGGHTEIIYFENFYNYKKIGQTLDDAIGEAYDKTARLLNLPYPGGPEISRLADGLRKDILSNPASTREMNSEFSLPRPMIHSNDFNFSFSGIKTSVLYMIKKINNKNQNEILEKSNELKIDEFTKSIIALEFENAVTEILIAKVKKAIQKYNIENIVIGGGVSANNFIRKSFEKLSNDENVKLFLPEKNLTGDNAFMIAAAAMMQIINQKSPTNLSEISAKSN